MSGLFLLLHTRLSYYRNYLRHHFDRRFIVEIILILFIFLYLVGRSPADIGFRLSAFTSPGFSSRWVAWWVALLPAFYLFAEFMAGITLRRSGEWQLLGSLPFSRDMMTRYHLLRHASKTFVWLFCGTILFLFDTRDVVEALLRSWAAAGLMLALQLVGFAQASVLRAQRSNTILKISRWLVVEGGMIFLLVQSASWLQAKLMQPASPALLGLSLSWLLVIALWLYIRRRHDPALAAVGERKTFARRLRQNRLAILAEVFILHDVLFLWRRRRAFFVLLFCAILICALVGVSQTDMRAAFAGSLFVQLLFGMILINSLLQLFEEEVKTAGLLRSLPLEVKRLWRSRWLFAACCLALPVLLPALILPFKFPLDKTYVLFIAFGVFLLPAMLALLYCTAGFAMFPHLRLAGLMLNVSLVLMFLFWFFMPFGTIILPGLALLWIRKAQRHFQAFEIT